MKRTNREDIYVSPVVIAKLFDDTRLEIGNEIFVDRKYKVLREGWIASMYAITLSMYQGVQWWLRPNPEDIAPDFYGFYRKESSDDGYKEGVNTSIEIFEWESHSSHPIISAINKKVNRLHDPKMSVVGHIAKENESINFLDIHNELSVSKPNVLEVWILAKIRELDSRYILTQVYPNLFNIPVPNGVPRTFIEPYSFMSKYKGKIDIPGGLLSINEEMHISIVDSSEEQ